MQDTKKQWEEFLNPNILRPRLLSMGLFMIAHEMLVDAIKGRLLDFFGENWTADGGWKPSAAYREKVLSLDPKGKNDALRGSIAWLRNIEAIDASDENTIKECTEARNKIAHELRDVMAGKGGPTFHELFPKLVDLVVKIDRWWIINVDIDTDPELAAKEIDFDDVTPGSLLVLQVMSQVALGDDEEAWEIYNWCVENYQKSKGSNPNPAG